MAININSFMCVIIVLAGRVYSFLCFHINKCIAINFDYCAQSFRRLAARGTRELNCRVNLWDECGSFWCVSALPAPFWFKCAYVPVNKNGSNRVTSSLWMYLAAHWHFLHSIYCRTWNVFFFFFMFAKLMQLQFRRRKKFKFILTVSSIFIAIAFSMFEMMFSGPRGGVTPAHHKSHLCAKRGEITFV